MALLYSSFVMRPEGAELSVAGIWLSAALNSVFVILPVPAHVGQVENGLGFVLSAISVLL
jgi:hypothetical protein